MITLRPAKIDDALLIHQAHMHSIQMLCASDYTKEQIEAWGNRPFNAERRRLAIQNDFVWVIDHDGLIEGYCELAILNTNNTPYANLCALYLTPKVKNQKLGRALLEVAEKQCCLINIKTITLHSTLTSLGFYEKMGFVKTANQTERTIRGVAIPCIPMMKILS